MSVKPSWDNEAKTVIRYDFDPRWTWEEFRIAAQEAFAMTKSVPHKVDTISYFPPGVALPADALFQFRRIMAAAPPNRGTTAIVGGSTFVRVLVGAFSKINKQLGNRLLLADSLDEARTTLAARAAQRVQ